MGITITFLALSVIFIIVTMVYINNKKRNSGPALKENLSKNSKSKKHLTDILQLQVIGNIICVKNRYSIIIRLGNIDYNMLSDAEQESIENTLIQVALSIDYPIQFFSTTEYIDTSKIISLIKSNRSDNRNIQEYQNYLLEYLNNLMENKTISLVKSYAIISYDGPYEEAIEELTRKANTFKNNLLRTKIICEVLNRDEVYSLIYRELNKGTIIDINNLRKGGNLYVGKKQTRN